ncbi:MAG TPA: aminoacyl--tRNA ligase-related protein [Candidatus Saccharimonadales bacterium]|nr:aminoacyl--tRNA ligase-related protein [Candidatus Saccharimonadales bacterium]
MRLSQLFTKTSKNVPADETAKNAQLLIKAGFVHKEMAGVYSYLPLGFKVIENIVTIVKEEMDAIGGVQMKTSALQSKAVWEQTNRWDDQVVDNWFKTELKNGTELGLSFTNEEAYSNILKNFVSSYKDLPIYVYDFKTIFRNETRSKSGLMRGREFYWKALYSYSISQEQHDAFYARAQKAYEKIFDRLGIGDTTFLTFASGGSFAQYSHEFQTLSDAGEDTIYLDRKKKIAVNEEVFNDEVLKDIGLNKSDLEEVRAIETANTFNLGTKFTKPFNLKVPNEKGEPTPIIMGCYGIGISRLMGTIAELLSDDKGLVWPENIAPAKVYLARLDTSEEVVAAADELYDKLTKQGVDVLYDDRDARPGEKFADADLLGIPYRVVVSAKTVEKKQFEMKKRQESDTKLLDIGDILKALATKK